MRVAISMCLLFAMSMNMAFAEIGSTVDTTASIKAAPSHAKIYLTDTATKSYDRLTKLLQESGYEVVEDRDSADYYLSIFKLQMLVEAAGKKTYIDLYNIDEFKDFDVPVSITDGDLKIGNADSLATGKVRGVFDMDGGVISQGSRLTSSGAGGAVIGMIGSLIGGLVDRATSKSNDPPLNVVIVRGAFTKKDEPKGAKIIIGIGSSTLEKPESLFNAAMVKFVSLVSGGFVKASDTSTKGD